MNSTFQNNIRRDIAKLKKDGKVIVFADKTSNMYKVDAKQYNKLLLENITKDYRKAPDGTINNINDEAYTMIKRNNIRGKIQKLDESPAFITIKDHKENFPNSIKCRLINPCKSQLGKVSKAILDRVNSKIRASTWYTQWKNTNDVIKWFNNVENKTRKSFIKFDVVEFYPSITKRLVLKAIEFAKQYDKIDKKEVDLILHSCDTILMNDGEPWIKKDCPDGETLFDVPMGSYHGAEVCEIVGLLILHDLSDVFKKGEYGLYRDDGLAAIDKRSPRRMELLKKSIRSIFKKNDLRVTIDEPSTTTDFLDVTLDLATNTHRPFRKTNASTRYVSLRSNHPPYIKRELPNMIQKRLSLLSKSADEFGSTKQPYQDALKNSGYKNNLVFDPSLNGDRKPRRKKRVIYFNPPFCSSLKTNLGKAFLDLVDKHFPKDGHYRKIFNRSTVKLSYSCMPNIKAIISAHNKSVLKKARTASTNTQAKTCNCRTVTCPVPGECLTKGVIYRAEVQTNNGSEFYIGSTGSEFKTRYYGHTYSFRHQTERDNTELSKRIHALKDRGTPYDLRWEFLHRTNATGPRKICPLCNLERLCIAFADQKTLLNNRSELTGKCKHFSGRYFPK